MEVQATTTAPSQTPADTICVGLVAGEQIDAAHPAELRALVESGEARTDVGKLAQTRVEGRRWLLVGLGSRDQLDAEHARVAAAGALGRARELHTKTLCWALPARTGDDFAAGLVQGTLLTAYRFDRYKSAPDRGEDGPLNASPLQLLVSTPDERDRAVRTAAELAYAQNAARDLQNTPANELTPTRLADRAWELSRELDGLSVEVDGRDELESRGMGAFAAVARGSEQEPALITLRYEGPAPTEPTLGYVGKAVTFDTGGISIKPAAKMHEMKFDMSGGAAVIESIGAIARLALPLRLVGVVGATENMPSGRSVKPGDIVRAINGTTIEVNNTDAEGRLVLADCLAWAIRQGAERVVDIATLTGGIVVALGSVHAGLLANDEAWAAVVEAAAAATGELVWRLPLHRDYAEMIKGRYADIVNAIEVRKASSIVAGEFLRRFVDETPWAHVDIAGTAYDLDRPYAAKGGSGFGVRLLVELARRASGE